LPADCATEPELRGTTDVLLALPQTGGQAVRGGHAALPSASSARVSKDRVISEPCEAALSYLSLDALSFLPFFF